MKRGRFFTISAFLFASTPAIVLALLIARYANDLPVMDDWPIGWFIFKELNDDFSLSDFLAQANESRPVFPRLLFLAISFVAGWDVRYQMALTLLLSCVISYNLYKLCSITVPGERSLHLLLMFFANLLIFNPTQYQNWLWGVQSIVFIPIFCLSTSLVICYSTCSTATKFLLTMLLSIVSTFSYANGMICWVLTAPILFLEINRKPNRSRGWLLVYILAMILNISLYFCDYKKPPFHPPFDYALHHPMQAIQYFFTFLGSPLDHFPNFRTQTLAKSTGFFTFGLLVGCFAYLFRYLRKSNLRDRLLPWLTIASYSLISAIFTMLGRSGFGIAQALDSRYISFSVYLPISLIFLGSIICHELKEHYPGLVKKSLTPITVLATLVIALYLFNTFHSIEIMRIRRQIELKGRTYLALIKVMPRAPLKDLVYPDIPWLQRVVPLMQEKGLLKLPFLENRDLSLIQEQNPKSALPCGNLEVIRKISKSRYEAFGWAFLPNKIEPAHAIFLAFKDNKGHPMLFQYAVGPFETRLDFGKSSGAWKYTTGKWKVPFSAKALPPYETDISAWAFDAISGEVYALDGVIGITP